MLLDCDPYSEKVFGIGLSRTGTSSLSAAFKMLEYNSAHWRNPFSDTILHLQDYYYFDACSDISTSYMFEALYFAFPNARFIYTHRDKSKWGESVRWHYNANSPKELLHKLRQIPATTLLRNEHPHELGAVFHFLHHVTYTDHDTWEAAYDAFEHRVNAFFSSHDESRLLRLDITTHPDPWGSLCEFLGKQRPAHEFPNMNYKRDPSHPGAGDIVPLV